MRFSTRLERIKPSETVEVIEKVHELEANGQDVVNFASGTQAEPRDFLTPENIREAAREALAEGQTHLAPSGGLPELRSAIANKFQRDNDVTVDPGQVIVTPGTKYAIFESILAFLNEGDEAVILDPSWVSYDKMVKIAGGEVNRVKLDDQFSLRNVDLDAAVSEDTKLLILNTPLNATGTVFSREGLEKLRDCAVENDFWVISDEIYEKLVYEGEHHSIASLDGMEDRTITVNGFSKTHSMHGWRLGYLAAPEEFVEQVEKVHSNSVTTVSTFVQHGAIEALEGPQDHVEKKREVLQARRDIMVEKLSEAGIEFHTPASGMYMLLPTGRDDDVEFCKEILEEKQVALTPGSAFGSDGYVRATWVLPEDELVAGLDSLVEYMTA